jgi:large subunit ribosomal protein L4
MTDVDIRSIDGTKKGSATLSESMFAVQPNVPVMHQVVTAQLAHRRAGTQSAKTRAEVRGGGAKPFKQKGTGRARAGSSRGPLWTGGGIALAPKPRDYTQRVPKKMVSLALRSALSDRANEDKIVVVDSFAWDAPSTKEAAKVLDSLGLDGKVLIVLSRETDEVAAFAFRNIPTVQIIERGELNAYDVLNNDWLVFTAETLALTQGGEGK